jgi:hypothetical protein
MKLGQTKAFLFCERKALPIKPHFLTYKTKGFLFCKRKPSSFLNIVSTIKFVKMRVDGVFHPF